MQPLPFLANPGGHFPPRNPIGNGIGDADPEHWVSREEAERMYMHRNPQAIEFERGTA